MVGLPDPRRVKTESRTTSTDEETQELDLALLTDSWADLMAWLPPDLETMAKDSGALKRRRQIRSGNTLLRMVLAYAALDQPMRNVSAWMAAQQLAHISDVAVLKRLRRTPAFLRQVLTWLLSQALPTPGPADLPYRVLLGDATCLREEGSTGTDWRLHVTYDPASARITAVDLTDAHQGEHLGHLRAGPGDLLVADRNYAHAHRLVALHQQGAALLVRIGHRAVRLYTADGQRFDPLAYAQRHGQKADRVEACPVWLKTKEGRVQARLIVVYKSREAAEQERQRLRKDAARKGRQVTERTLAAAAYVFLLTTVPEAQASATVLAELYRVRWQVELLFRRLKSLLHLDAIRAHEPEVVQSYLLGKLITAVLAETIARQARAFSPWGLPLGPAAASP